MNQEERASAVFEAIAREPDRKRRNAMLRIVQDELSFEKKRRDAQDAAQGRALFEQARELKLTPLQAGQLYNNVVATPEARAYAAELTYGKAARESVENRAALRQGKILVDMGQMETPEDREAYAINYGLTNSQVNDRLGYRGKDEDLPVSRAQRIYKTVVGDEEMPEGFYDAVIRRSVRRSSIRRPPRRNGTAQTRQGQKARHPLCSLYPPHRARYVRL